MTESDRSVCLIVDDEISTAGTLIEAARFLQEHGAESVQACATHPVFAGPALTRIMESNLQEVVVCDSIPVRDKVAEYKAEGRIKVLPLANLFAKAIRRIHDGDSVSGLFR